MRTVGMCSLAVLAAAWMTAAPSPAGACWLAPPQTTWQEAPSGHAVKRDNVTGTLAIFTPDRSERLWETRLPAFSGLFSQVEVVGNGSRVIHIRTNHMVSGLEDEAVRIVERSGKTRSIKVGQLISRMMYNVSNTHTSTDPPSAWLEDVASISDRELVLFNAQGQQRVIDLVSGMVRIPDPCDQSDGDGVPARVQGVVLDTEGQPVPDAWVVCGGGSVFAHAGTTFSRGDIMVPGVKKETKRAPAQVTRTDARGNYQCSQPPGPLLLMALAKERGLVQETAARRALCPGAHERWNLVMRKMDALQGRVVDEKGRAVAQAEVRAWASGKRVGHAEHALHALNLRVILKDAPEAVYRDQVSSTSDAAGQFTQWVPYHGLHHVSVQHPDFQPTDVEGRPGEPLTVTMQRMDRSVRLQGLVLNSAGHPVVGATVVAESPGPTLPTGTATTDDRGQFTMDLAPARYKLLTARTEMDSPLVATADLTGGPASVTLQFQEGQSISGVVRDSAGHPVAGVRVLAAPDLDRNDHEARTKVLAAAEDGLAATGSATTDADGRYAISRLRPLNYVMVVNCGTPRRMPYDQRPRARAGGPEVVLTCP